MRSRTYPTIACLWFLGRLHAVAPPYPAPESIQRIFDVPDLTKADVSLPIKALDGKELYRLECHSAGYAGDPDFDYSGDFECRLILSNGQNLFSTLLTEDANQSRDWESRGRFFAADIKNECARIPEFGSVRTFALRGMRLRLRIMDPKFRGDELLSLRLAVDISADPNAHRAIAAVVPLPKEPTPASCRISEYFVNPEKIGKKHRK